MWGDPHFWAFDRARMVNFYRTGTFWIMKSDPVWIQGYYAPSNTRRPMYTHLQKVAVGGPFLEGSTMMVEATKIWWNDEEDILPFSTDGQSAWTGMNGKVNIQLNVRSYQHAKVSILASFPNEISLSIKIYYHRSLPYMGMTISTKQITGQDGHCGNFNGDGSDDTTSTIKQRFGAQVESGMKLIPY